MDFNSTASLSGQIIQICFWGSNSPGMRKPSFFGVESILFAIFQCLPFFLCGGQTAFCGYILH